MAKKKIKKQIKKSVKKSVKKVVKKVAKKVVKKTATQKKTQKIVKKTIQKSNKKNTVVKKAVAIQPAAKKPVKLNVDYAKAVTPLGDRLIVRLAAPETRTAGGLYIPDMVNTASGYLKGEVLVVGQGHRTKKGFLRSMDVQKGDQILFSEHTGTKIVFNSEELHIVNETDVLGVIQK